MSISTEDGTVLPTPNPWNTGWLPRPKGDGGGWITPCDELREYLNKKGEQPFAATGCVNGTPFACVWWDRIWSWPHWKGATSKAFEAIYYCMEKHELEHVAQISKGPGCPPGEDVTPFDPGQNKHPWEKAAYEVEIDCYNSKLPEFDPAAKGIDFDVVKNARLGACDEWKNHNNALPTPDPPYAGCQ
jgi:hypothetical protein